MRRIVAAMLLFSVLTLASGCSLAVFSKTHDGDMRQYSAVTFVDQGERDHKYLFALYDGNVGHDSSQATISLLQLYSTTVDTED